MTVAIDDCNALRKQLLSAYRSMPYAEYLQSDHWQEVRKVAIEQRGKLCQLCGQSGELHVHHNSYKNLGKELPEELVVLCAICHAKFHDKVVGNGAKKDKRENPMRLVAVKRIGNYKIALTFADGLFRLFDFEPILGDDVWQGLTPKIVGQAYIDDNYCLCFTDFEYVIDSEVLYFWPDIADEFIARAREHARARNGEDPKTRRRRA